MLGAIYMLGGPLTLGTTHAWLLGWKEVGVVDRPVKGQGWDWDSEPQPSRHTFFYFTEMQRCTIDSSVPFDSASLPFTPCQPSLPPSPSFPAPNSARRNREKSCINQPPLSPEGDLIWTRDRAQHTVLSSLTPFIFNFLIDFSCPL